MFSVGQIAAIIGLLMAFGVPQASINNVQAILEGQSAPVADSSPLLGNSTQTVDTQPNEPVVTMDLRVAPAAVLKDFPAYQNVKPEDMPIQQDGDRVWVFLSGDWDKASLSLRDPQGVLRAALGMNPPGVCNYGDNCYDAQHKGESGIFIDVRSQTGDWKWEVKAIKNGVEVTKDGTYTVQ